MKKKWNFLKKQSRLVPREALGANLPPKQSITQALGYLA